jgi:Kef-type K+ transport system membrane component KefB
MESYLCFLGVEYGVVNIICVIVFFISLLRYFIKNKSVEKNFYAIGMSITITYMLFLVFAYMGDSWLYAMPFLGLIVGVIEKRKQYKKSISM